MKAYELELASLPSDRHPCSIKIGPPVLAVAGVARVVQGLLMASEPEEDREIKCSVRGDTANVRRTAPINMHRLLVLPYAVLTLATAAIVFMPSSVALVLFLVSILAAFACVPVISQRNLLAGYGAMAAPFVALVVAAYFSPHVTVPAGAPNVEVTVQNGDVYVWKTPNGPGSMGHRVLIRGESHAHFGPVELELKETEAPKKAPNRAAPNVTSPAAQEAGR